MRLERMRLLRREGGNVFYDETMREPLATKGVSAMRCEFVSSFADRIGARPRQSCRRAWKPAGAMQRVPCPKPCPRSCPRNQNSRHPKLILCLRL
jgi:hypothetical protein